jgi:hypothetical protein
MIAATSSCPDCFWNTLTACVWMPDEPGNSSRPFVTGAPSVWWKTHVQRIASGAAIACGALRQYAVGVGESCGAAVGCTRRVSTSAREMRDQVTGIFFLS